MKRFAADLLIRAAAWLLPAAEKGDWLREWRAELFHVESQQPGQQVLAFSLGAFQDAWWLRCNHHNGSAHAALAPRRGWRTPSRCILTLLAVAAVCVLLAWSRGSVWNTLRPDIYQDERDLVTISRAGYERANFPTIALSEYSSWLRRSSHLFRGLAFYAPAASGISLRAGSPIAAPVMQASNNLFDLLGVPIAFNTHCQTPAHQTCLYLSRSLWITDFHADVHVFGQPVQVAGHQAVVAGLIEDESWRLPGHAGAWLLEDARHLALLPPETQGFVLAHAAPLFTTHPQPRVTMYVGRQDEGYDWFVCESLAARLHQPLTDFLFALLLACLALPATTSLPLGDYPAPSAHIPWATRMRRWAFLSIKFVLIVGIVGFASISFAFWNPALSPNAQEMIQSGSAFWGLLFAFRWALSDQRKRCPVCLCTLTHPARVGQFSRNFLAWNGTELVCLSGHGLLHVPDLSTSWFSSQRWLYLDSSWRSLFPVT